MSTKKAIQALRQDNANKFREMIIESLNKKISDLMEDSKKIVGLDIFETKGDLFSRWKMLEEARLDELSNKKVGEYMVKAEKSIKDMDNERSRATLDRMLSKGPDSKPSKKENRLFDKAKQRDKYAEKAYKRITK